MKDKQLLLAVLAQLEREKAVSIPQLAHLLATSENEVYAALEVLVFAYDAASIRLDLHDTYAVLETRGKDRLLRLTGTEADALVDALLAAGFSQDDELVRALADTKGLLGASEPRMQTIGVRDSSKIAQAVAAACEDEAHHLLEIEYRGEDDGEPHVRVVEPRGIFSREGHRYLQAYCRKAHGWRSFRIDRIEMARQLEESFEPRNDAPAIESTLWQGSVEAHVRLDADCPLPPWPGLRASRAGDDGSKPVSVTWTGSSWLPRHIVALMGAAIPLDPPELVEACRRVAEELTRLANDRAG